MNGFAKKLAAIAIMLAGGIAHADDTYAQVRRELNKGKDYSAAWNAVSRSFAPIDSPQLVEEGRKQLEALNSGKDYAASWAAARDVEPSARAPRTGGKIARK